MYGACCGRFLGEFAASGALTAPAPEQLMRSRFTAFAIGDAAYLLSSWHPSTRPSTLELEDDIRWYRLDILGSSGGVRCVLPVGAGHPCGGAGEGQHARAVAL